MTLSQGLRVAAVWVVSLGTAFSSASASATVTLDAQASKAEYALGEPLGLQLTLSLSASAPGAITVCARSTGTIRILRLQRDGVAVRPRKTTLFFEEDPAVLQEQALQTVAPGGSIGIAYGETSLRGDYPTLRDVRVGRRSGRPHKALVYDLPGPGAYTLLLAYDYNGRDGGQANVLRTRVVSNTVSFRLL